jgi:hypothetical protein
MENTEYKEVVKALEKVSKSSDMLVEKIISNRRRQSLRYFFTGVAAASGSIVVILSAIALTSGGSLCFA